MFPYKYRVTVWVHALSHAHSNPFYLIVTDVGLAIKYRILITKLIKCYDIIVR